MPPRRSVLCRWSWVHLRCNSGPDDSAAGIVLGPCSTANLNATGMHRLGAVHARCGVLRVASELPLFPLLNFCNRVLPVDVLRVELDLVASLQPLEQGRIGAKHHGHTFVHGELLDRSVL